MHVCAPFIAVTRVNMEFFPSEMVALIAEHVEKSFGPAFVYLCFSPVCKHFYDVTRESALESMHSQRTAMCIPDGSCVIHLMVRHQLDDLRIHKDSHRIMMSQMHFLSESLFSRAESVDAERIERIEHCFMQHALDKNLSRLYTLACCMYAACNPDPAPFQYLVSKGVVPPNSEKLYGDVGRRGTPQALDRLLDLAREYWCVTTHLPHCALTEALCHDRVEMVHHIFTAGFLLPRMTHMTTAVENGSVCLRAILELFMQCASQR